MSGSEPKSWAAADSATLYGVERWGAPYFHVSAKGRLEVVPEGAGGQAVDLKELVERLQQRGLELPILVRFNGILRHRLSELSRCFAEAIDEHTYGNRYRAIYPIKVNQQADVVRQVMESGREFGAGVEAGSKSELLAVIALADVGTPIICNGFKDDEFIQLVLLAQQIGHTIIPVIEKASELDLVLKHSEKLGLRPRIGMRVKLAARGSGRWQASGGYRSKFGLTVAEVLRELERLRAAGLVDCFKLLHFHVGSQITHVRQLKAAILEAARIYVDLHRRGAGLEILDVGGGLGVDYDGSRTDRESSMNYTMQEYANDVVYHVQAVCDEAGVPHPELVSESGRAIAAHHSVLVVETLGVTEQGNVEELPSERPEQYEPPVRDLWDTYRELTAENYLEFFHDAQAALDLAMNLFSGGYLPLEQRVVAENLYFAICQRVRELTAEMPRASEEVQHLDRMLSDIYFVNFSLFQSVPDAWAIDQLFPIMPIHRLDEPPSRHAVLADITCDSDGKIGRFVGNGESQQTLRLHRPEAGESYQLGIFLIGAYQEILGDLHNLFGDTHAAHVDVGDDAVTIQSIVKGDTVSDVLGYVQFDHRELIQRLQEAVEAAVEENRIDADQASRALRYYEQAFGSYTYFTGDGE